MKMNVHIHERKKKRSNLVVGYPMNAHMNEHPMSAPTAGNGEPGADKRKRSTHKDGRRQQRRAEKRQKDADDVGSKGGTEE